jgi:hypothetical protein
MQMANVKTMRNKHRPKTTQELIFKSEFEMMEELYRFATQNELSPEVLLEKFTLLCHQYSKLLRTLTKLTKISDGYQIKLQIAKDEAEEKNTALEKAMEKIETLSGLLPICSHCKQIRDEEGQWHQIETYIATHSKAEFSHSLCQKCFSLLYPQYVEKLKTQT